MRSVTRRNPALARPIDWNSVDDPFDLEVWNKLTSNFWLPEKVPMAQDIPHWATLTDNERLSTVRVFAGLTMLDTIQSFFGAPVLALDAVTPHEAAVFSWIGAQESIHAKSYSNIFSTLCSSSDIDEAFRWSEENEYLRRKSEIIMGFYEGSEPLKRKVASVLLESMLFYAGFYMPFHWASRGKLSSSADMIRLILRDEAVHGTYIGTKFAQGAALLPESERKALMDFTYELTMELYENEVKYTQSLYDPLGLTEDVTKFVHYNANKALMNLGYDPLFPAEICDVSPAILAQLSLGSEVHDFFSGSGSAYVQAKVEAMSTDDWDF